MSFNRLNTVVRTGGALGSWQYSFHRGRGDGSVPRLSITLTEKALAGVKVDPDAKWEFLLGEGDDAGKCRIIQVDIGTKATVNRHAVTFRFGHVPALGNVPKSKVAVAEITPVEGGWELPLPEWFGEQEQAA